MMPTIIKSIAVLIILTLTTSLALAKPPADKSNGTRQASEANAAAIDALTSMVETLQAQVAALEAEANTPLRDRIAGNTYAVRTTGHGISGDPDDDFEPGFYERSLQNPFRDFSVSSGTLELRDDNTYSLRSTLVVIGTANANQDGGAIGLYRTNTFELNGDGVWYLDELTNEVVLVDGPRLQSSPNGEVLTTVSNDIRLAEGFADGPDFYLTFIADAVYIQLPQ